MNREEYGEYLSSPEWRARARMVKRGAGERCQVCNAEGELHAHHRTYERIGDEHPSDLIALCADCHARAHNVDNGHPKYLPPPLVVLGDRIEDYLRSPFLDDSVCATLVDVLKLIRGLDADWNVMIEDSKHGKKD